MKNVSALVLVAVFSVLVAPATVVAQSPGPVEVGGHVSILQLEDSTTTNTGFGGRVAWHLAPWGALEAEANYFPDDRFIHDSSPAAFSLRYERRRTDLFAGPKLGFRSERFGVFGKVRPGLTWLANKGVGCEGEVCALILIAEPEYRTEFALDLGGVFEFYPSSRSVLRGDVGTRLIWNRSSAPPCDDCTTQNFASSIGVGYRF